MCYSFVSESLKAITQGPLNNGSIELECLSHEKADSQEDMGTQTETEQDDNKEAELQKSLSFGDRDADAKSHSFGYVWLCATILLLPQCHVFL